MEEETLLDHIMYTQCDNTTVMEHLTPSHVHTQSNRTLCNRTTLKVAKQTHIHINPSVKKTDKQQSWKQA